MKNLIYTVAFVMLVSPALAESPIKYTNLSSTEPDKLYVGIVNTLKFDDASIQSIRIDGVTYHLEDGYFNINMSKVGKFQAEIYSGDRVVETIDFLSKRVTDPALQLGDYTGQYKLTKEQILSNPKLQVTLPNCSVVYKFEVVSFTGFIIPKKGDLYEYVSYSSSIPNNTLSLLKDMPQGTVLLIENVLVVDPNGSKRKIAGMSIQLI